LAGASTQTPPGNLQHSLNPLAGFQGPTSKEKGDNRRGKGKQRGRGGED